MVVTVATAQRDKTAAQKRNDQAVSLPLFFFFFLIYCEAFWNNPLKVFDPIKWNTASTLCEVCKHDRQRHRRTWHASHNKSRCTLHFSCPPWFRASCTGKWHFSVMYLPSNDAIKFMQVDILDLDYGGTACWLYAFWQSCYLLLWWCLLPGYSIFFSL